MNKSQPMKLQWCWYILLFVILGIGIYLVLVNPMTPQVIWRVSSKIRTDKWSILIGIYLISIVVTYLLIFYTMRFLHFLLALSGTDKEHDPWSSTVIGVCESIMYPAALLMEQGDFIGLWLALKVAGQWVRWRGEIQGEKDSIAMQNEGRRRFNRFLVGNALSVLFAGATYIAFRIWVFNEKLS